MIDKKGLQRFLASEAYRLVGIVGGHHMLAIHHAVIAVNEKEGVGKQAVVLLQPAKVAIGPGIALLYLPVEIFPKPVYVPRIPTDGIEKIENPPELHVVEHHGKY